MPNTELRAVTHSSLVAVAGTLALLIAFPASACAQRVPQGYSVERLYASAPGGGWFVMDELNMSGRLGGAIALTTGYARNPLQLTSPTGPGSLALISNQAFVDVGLAVTWDRYRVYLNLPMPVVVGGQSGTLGGSALVAPNVNLGATPDLISDTRIGFDVRVHGDAGSPLRLGAGAQVMIPSGSRDNFDSDGGLRGIFRFLMAGDRGLLSYAGQLGLQLRPYEPGRLPGSPNGDELLFGASIGRKLATSRRWSVTVGPELFGVVPVHSASGGQAGVEGLLTTRLDPIGDRPHFRLKVGVGHSIVRYAGSPDWRVVAGVELFGQRARSTTR